MVVLVYLEWKSREDAALCWRYLKRFSMTRGRNLYTLKVCAIVYMRTLFMAKSRQAASNALRNLNTPQEKEHEITIACEK